MQKCNNLDGEKSENHMLKIISRTLTDFYNFPFIVFSFNNEYCITFRFLAVKIHPTATWIEEEDCLLPHTSGSEVVLAEEFWVRICTLAQETMLENKQVIIHKDLQWKRNLQLFPIQLK